MTRELEDLIEESKRKVAAMTPEERDAMIKEQAESWVRAEMNWPETSTMIAVTPPTDRQDVQSLVAKAKALVALLDDAEVNHGGLVGGVTLRAKNDLRLELSKWK